MRRLPLCCLHPGCKEIVVFRDGCDIDDLSQPVQVQVDSLRCQKNWTWTWTYVHTERTFSDNYLSGCGCGSGPLSTKSTFFVFHLHTTTLLVEEWIFDFNDLPSPLVSIERKSCGNLQFLVEILFTSNCLLQINPLLMLCPWNYLLVARSNYKQTGTRESRLQQSQLHPLEWFVDTTKNLRGYH